MTDSYPIVCTLSASEQAQRGESTAQNLLSGVMQVEESADGYRLQFPGDETWINRLVQFINLERECCLFLKFQLMFEPGQGPVWLGIGGGPGAKEFIAGMALIDRGRE